MDTERRDVKLCEKGTKVAKELASDQRYDDISNTKALYTYTRFLDKLRYIFLIDC